MKTFKIALLIALFLLASVAFLVEILNPHSFLQAHGAFLRALALFIAIPIWIAFSKKESGQFLILGIVLLSVMSGAYLLYGIRNQQQEAYYEKYIKPQYIQPIAGH